MRVFISWSGTRSKETARLLHWFLPQVLNDVDPWMSDEDLNVGNQWGNEIVQQLNESSFGIICVTPGNVNRPWLNFEAGAISKSVGDELSRVAPFLIGMVSKNELTGPLSRYQAIQPNHDDVWKLIQALNSSLSRPRTIAAAQESLDVWWPKFYEKYQIVESSKPASHIRERTDSAKIDEMLEIVRGLSRSRDLGVAHAGVVEATSTYLDAPRKSSLSILSEIRQLIPRDASLSFEGRNISLGVPDSNSIPANLMARLQDLARAAGGDLTIVEGLGR